MYKKIESITDWQKQALLRIQNNTITHAILEKNNPGDIYSCKNYIIVRSSGFYSLLVGELEQEEVESVIKFLNNLGKVNLICDQKYHHWFLLNKYQLCPRIELSYINKTITIPTHQYEVKSIDDIDIFSKCVWFEFISTLYGNSENFFNNGFGVALFNNNILISEAYAAFIGGGVCEIGIATHPDFQGKGIATLAVKHIISETIKRKLIPFWSCNYENSASLRVALKSGFEQIRYYAFLTNNQ